MEAANAGTFYTRLSMLLASAEGFAGEISVNGKITTDKNALIGILGQELYDKLYAYGTGLRHKLLHGNIQAHHLFDGLPEQVYDKLREYLKVSFGIQLDENVVHPQRNFIGNFLTASTFEKLADESYLDLPLIVEAFDEDNLKKQEVEAKIFNGYCEGPENY
jgi:hypothetical protein